MSKPNSVPYAIRNDLCTRLNKSSHGFFLDEALRRGSIHALRIANSAKLTAGLIKLLSGHPALLAREVQPEGEGKNRWWVISTKKNHDRSPPEGYSFVEEVEAEQAQPSSVEISVYQEPPQTTKYDERPEPSPVVYSTKPLEKSSAFEALKNVAPRIVEEERPVVEEVVVSVEPIDQEEKQKEPEMTSSVATSALSQAALLRKQAEEMTALAANLEREDAAVKRLEELRPVQLEIARATAIMQRTTGEMLDAMEILEKASEKLRVLVTGR